MRGMRMLLRGMAMVMNRFPSAEFQTRPRVPLPFVCRWVVTAKIDDLVRASFFAASIVLDVSSSSISGIAVGSRSVMPSRSAVEVVEDRFPELAE